MNIRRVVTATSIFAAAGTVLAQPVVDGTFDPATEGSFYSDIVWANNVPTGFGNNEAGDFSGGNFGDPENVTTGIEIRIPLSALGLSGNETIRMTGWVNSSDRTFKSNQIIGSLPIDTPNLGGAQDFNAAPFDGTTQHISVDLSSIATGAETVDGLLDSDVIYTRVFLQQNYTGFGNETDGTVDGSGPNGGGSEIDAVYMAKNGGDLYIFVAGNLEFNGNGLDMYIDTGAGGDATLGSASGSGGFIPSGQSGLDFDAGFDADYVLSIDSTDDDADGLTPNVPRAYFGGINAGIDLLGTLPGYGASNAGVPTGGDAGVPGVTIAVDNSNTIGVEGNPASPTPIAPDTEWAYGSELNNVRAYVDNANNRLYVFVGSNMEVNYNKVQFFFDVRPGGQSTILDTNVDISFNAVNNQAGITFDSGFAADYWMNFNTGVDGGTNADVRFMDATVLRTNGAQFDPFFGVITDYGSYFGGDVAAVDFSGPRLDIQDGSLGGLYAEYAPRLISDDAFNGVPPTGIPGLINVVLNNSNVGGVTDTTADSAAVRAVNTGIEFSIDLDELGWDGSQDILMAGWISNAGFDFVSNQVFGGLPSGSANIGPRDTDGDGVADLDWNTIAGDQFINLTNPPVSCPADLAAPFGVLNIFDIQAYIGLYNGQDAAADLAAPFGTFNIFDIQAFIGLYNQGCP